ncbi:MULTISPECIES: tripartite tricarboxylate transporter substrate-binding protein [unclassified Massilia]|uniref:tripartite tricarboxylate transporter substrate-binding protein n=1 Tax=unclassified Massilia TaxID=2609279 RepID=UPI00178638BC|nr:MULTISPECIES: tripartite tricarboxylate transporter substrate-binding protein [unclassified Massilia]MBD8529289.1 tripartite tricarboxylate transporter substrate binding protein BugD [Massilia sp. CFBP 13647]MBD8672683.1 tripartite tricarboxylate transporter substrate binding protein BugD [Massilia sp. CFBP 13721]
MLKKLIVASAALLAANAVLAADYPDQTITMVIPFSAGGPTDTIARILAQTMSKSLKQTVIVENALGAGGTLAAGRVMRARPDGYTVLLHHNGMATSPAMYRKLAFNPLGDFEYIGQAADVPMVLVARKDLPPNNLKELIAYVKANKGKLSMGNAGLGAVSHQCGMLFLSAIGTPITTVPYKGTAPAMNDLLGGQIDLLCDQTTSTTSHIRAGKVKVYGATTKARVASLPNVPTLAEQGMPGFEMYVWHGLYAPKGTPQPIIAKLGGALREAMADPNVKAKFADLGAETVAADKATPAGLQTHLKAEMDKWGPIYKKAGAFAD